MKQAVFTASFVIYAAYFAGLVLLLRNELSYIWGRLSLRRSLSRAKKKAPGPVEAKLDSLVFMALGKEKKGKKLGFFCLILFAGGFIYSLSVFSVFFSLIIALLAASVPIISLVSKIQNQRNRSGKEGQAFVNEIYRQYLIGNKNILTALEKSSVSNDEYPFCARQAYLLLLRLRSAEGKGEVKRACSDFSGAVGSLWAKSLAAAVQSSYFGFDISEALLDLVERMKMRKEDTEERKRLNSEAFRMTVFLVPAMYVSTMIMSVKILGMSPKELLSSQFGNRTGLLLFMLISLLFFINCMLLSCVSESSTDR